MIPLGFTAWEPRLSPTELFAASAELGARGHEDADPMAEFAATFAAIRNLPETTERSPS